MTRNHPPQQSTWRLEARVVDRSLSIRRGPDHRGRKKAIYVCFNNADVRKRARRHFGVQLATDLSGAWRVGYS
jgi:hypothetical protein